MKEEKPDCKQQVLLKASAFCSAARHWQGRLVVFSPSYMVPGSWRPVAVRWPSLNLSVKDKQLNTIINTIVSYCILVYSQLEGPCQTLGQPRKATSQVFWHSIKGQQSHGRACLHRLPSIRLKATNLLRVTFHCTLQR